MGGERGIQVTLKIYPGAGFQGSQHSVCVEVGQALPKQLAYAWVIRIQLPTLGE